jgi:mannosyltransferase
MASRGKFGNRLFAAQDDSLHRPGLTGFAMPAAWRPVSVAESSLARRLAQILACALVVLAFALRVYHLGFQSLWSDEGISLLRSGQTLGAMLANMPAEHVPGYFVLLHFWMGLTGTSDFALRYLSLWPSVLVIALAYRLAADLGSRPAGLIGALLLACNFFQLWYAQEARMYSWLLATGLASIWLLWRLLAYSASFSSRGGRTRFYLICAGYVLTTAAAIYFHYYGFLLPLAQTVFVLIWLAATRAWRRAAAWVACGLAVVVLFLPWLPRVGGLFAFSGFREPISPWGLPWQFWTAYTVGDGMPEPWHTWLPALYLVLALAGFLVWWRQNRLGASLLLVMVAAPLAGALALALRKPDYHERYLIFVSAPLMLLAGRGLLAWSPFEAQPPAARGRAGWGSLLALALGIALLVVLVRSNGVALARAYTDPAVQKDDYRGLAHYVQAMEKPGDLILAERLDPQQVFAHYYRGAQPFYDVRQVERGTNAEVDALLGPLTAGARRVWALRYNHPPGPIEIWLANHGWQTAKSYFGAGGLVVTLYGLPALQQTEQPVQIKFGPSLRLTNVTLAGAEKQGNVLQAHAGDLLGITTQWQVAAPLPALNFGLRLQDATGRVRLADDYVPIAGTAPTNGWRPGQEASDRRGLLLPIDLPPGPYQIRLELYDPNTGAPLTTDQKATSGLLATINVVPALTAPDPSTLPIQIREDERLGSELSLLGWEVDPDPVPVAQGGTLSVWWRALAQPTQNYQVLFQLTSKDGRPAGTMVYPLSSAPTNNWRPGEIVREEYHLTPDSGATSGSYRLKVSLLGSDGAELGPSLRTGELVLRARPRVYRLPQITRPLNIRVGDLADLRGFDTQVEAKDGGDLQLALYWQPRQRGAAAYKVFVHLLDEKGQLVAQADDWPAGGAAPTESWLPGEVVTDRHSLPKPASGPYQIQIGLYDPATGARLPAWDQSGQMLPDGTISLQDVVVP